MSAMHTPGPWSVRKNEYGDVVVDSESIGVCNVGRDAMGNAPAIANFGHEQGPMVEADARLIAASPDLLAACEAALLEIEQYSSNGLWEQFIAAIAKARGQ